ncbi:ribbon-helix-helix domain-containing protein [Salinibacter altiplanensis]|uniref:ribbon-helix-helix domain-containing protein n=1 Tax=Salinibacter altiplanensis TaxID=1803181 RepID=UPI00131A4AA2|nr:ribbon-helix-helix domain-containing protein [Salinibacter altiplanensis]
MPPTSDASDTDQTGGALSAALETKTETNADPSAASRGGLTEGEEVKFNARIPENLRDAFSELCDQEGRSMSWVVREYMRRAVQQGETGL